VCGKEWQVEGLNVQVLAATQRLKWTADLPLVYIGLGDPYRPAWGGNPKKGWSTSTGIGPLARQRSSWPVNPVGLPFTARSRFGTSMKQK